MTCPSGKKRHSNSTEAENALSRIWRRAWQGQMPIRTYRCPLCEGWHLTKSPLRHPQKRAS